MSGRFVALYGLTWFRRSLQRHSGGAWRAWIQHVVV